MKLLLIFIFIVAQKIPTFKAIQAQDADYTGEIDGVFEVMPGCSWYCGADISNITASSHLPKQKFTTYTANKAHDFDFKTAWIVGKPGNGQFLEYTFDMRQKEDHNLAITQLIIANGYKKTRSTWKEHARVKKMKLFINDKPFANIELLDAYEFQTVDIDTIKLPLKKVMKLKFVIMDIYAGSKYKNDVAITELLLDGTGVH